MHKCGMRTLSESAGVNCSPHIHTTSEVWLAARVCTPPKAIPINSRAAQLALTAHTHLERDRERMKRRTGGVIAHKAHEITHMYHRNKCDTASHL